MLRRLVVVVLLLLVPLIFAQVDVNDVTSGEKRRRSDRLLGTAISLKVPALPRRVRQPRSRSTFPMESLPELVLAHFAEACPLAALHLVQVSRIFRKTVQQDQLLYERCIYRVAMEQNGNDILAVVKQFSLGTRVFVDDELARAHWTALIPILRTYQRLGHSLSTDPFLLRQLAVTLRQAVESEEIPVVEYILRAQSNPFPIPIRKLVEMSIQHLDMEVFPKLLPFLSPEDRQSAQLKHRYLGLAVRSGSLRAVYRVFCEWKGVSTAHRWVPIHLPAGRALTATEQTDIVRELVRNQFRWKDWYAGTVASFSRTDINALLLHFVPTMEREQLTQTLSTAIRHGNQVLVNALSTSQIPLPGDLLDAAGASGSTELVRHAIIALGTAEPDLEPAVRGAINDGHTMLVFWMLQASYLDFGNSHDNDNNPLNGINNNNNNNNNNNINIINDGKLRFRVDELLLGSSSRLGVERVLDSKPFLVDYFGCDLAFLLLTDVTVSLTLSRKFFSKDFLADCGLNLVVDVGRYGSVVSFEYVLSALPLDTLDYPTLMATMSEVVGIAVDLGKPQIVREVVEFLEDKGLTDERYTDHPLQPRFGMVVLNEEEETGEEEPVDTLLHPVIRAFLAYSQLQQSMDIPLSARDKEFLFLYAPPSVIIRHLPYTDVLTARDLEAAAKRCQDDVLRKLMQKNSDLEDNEILEYLSTSLPSPDTRCLLAFQERMKEPVLVHFGRQADHLLQMSEDVWQEEVVERWDRVVVRQLLALLPDTIPLVEVKQRLQSSFQFDR